MQNVQELPNSDGSDSSDGENDLWVNEYGYETAETEDGWDARSPAIVVATEADERAHADDGTGRSRSLKIT